MIFRVGNS